MIPHNRPTIGQAEEEAALRVLRSGWLAQGREVGAFEDDFCRFLGLPERHAVALSSGTAALYLALRVVGAAAKRVALPVFSCSALTNAVDMVGAKAELLDSGEETPNVDPELLRQSEAEIAIIPHIFGLPFPIPEMEGRIVIEDCAQAIGATVGRSPVGLQGDVGIFSFAATKVVTSGGTGGMLVSKHRSLAEKARDFREYDQRRDRLSRFNFQMSDLQATIGRAQLKQLPDFLSRRREIFRLYRKAQLDLVDNAYDPEGPWLDPTRFRAVLRTAHPQGELMRLRKMGVSSIVPLEEWELLGEPDRFPKAQKWTRSTLSLPCYPTLEDSQVNRVTSSLFRGSLAS